MPVLRNSRHEKFAQEMAKAKTATAAMAAAGYSDPRNSTRLTKNDEIRRRIDELKERFLLSRFVTECVCANSVAQRTAP